MWFSGVIEKSFDTGHTGQIVSLMCFVLKLLLTNFYFLLLLESFVENWFSLQEKSSIVFHLDTVKKIMIYTVQEVYPSRNEHVPFVSLEWKDGEDSFVLNGHNSNHLASGSPPKIFHKFEVKVMSHVSYEALKLTVYSQKQQNSSLRRKNLPGTPYSLLSPFDMMLDEFHSVDQTTNAVDAPSSL